jgi:hypothetical protein
VLDPVEDHVRGLLAVVHRVDARRQRALMMLSYSLSTFSALFGVTSSESGSGFDVRPFLTSAGYCFSLLSASASAFET